MPVYEYSCEACGGTTEALRPMRDADAPITCACCGSEKTRRTHSVFAAGPSSRQDVPGCPRCGDPQGPCSV